jgi:hypothetical protein
MQDELVEVVTRIRKHEVTDGRCFRFGIAASAARVAVVFNGDCVRWQYDFGAVLATTQVIVSAGCSEGTQEGDAEGKWGFLERVSSLRTAPVRRG